MPGCFSSCIRECLRTCVRACVCDVFVLSFSCACVRVFVRGCVCAGDVSARVCVRAYVSKSVRAVLRLLTRVCIASVRECVCACGCE